MGVHSTGGMLCATWFGKDLTSRHTYHVPVQLLHQSITSFSLSLFPGHQLLGVWPVLPIVHTTALPTTAAPAGAFQGRAKAE